MRKIFLVLIALVFYSTSVVAVEKFKFKYNSHENLPKKWIPEFKNIMNIVQEVMPINENTNDWVKRNLAVMEPFPIYAWLNTNKDPFPKFKKNGQKFIMNESAIMGDGQGKNWMQLKVHKQDLTNNISMSYYVVAHEYFHIYQISLSENKLSDRDSPKWLTEGGAKVFEEMYVKQYYGKDSLKNDLQRTKMWSKKVLKEPSLYEKHKTSNKKGMDGNYTGSAFMVLVLVNELEKNNISEQQAFQLVFRDFWIERAKHRKWEKAFEQTFKMSAEEFYERLSKYKRGRLKNILPSKNLKIQDIFS